MDVRREREHLAEADRHIAAAKRHIERQKEVIEKLGQGGHDTRTAKSLLDALERGLDAFEQHRKIILETIKNLEAVKAKSGD